jgi:alkaline phosphatase
MRKLTFILALMWLCLGMAQAQQAKYVFYFIGDGMGVNQVLATQMYRSELKGEIGVTPLLFTQFPYATMATTYSATNGVTDSAASGSALATGRKTKNGALGVLKDLETPVNSVAVWAKQNGYRVGVSTSVSVDHATPAAFYAHVPKRKMYHQIGKDLVKADFDFYAGSDFLEPTDKADTTGQGVNLYALAQQNGYTIARGYKDYLKKAKKSDKMILFQPESATDIYSIPFAIDRQKGDLALSDIVRAGIHFLSKDAEKGFFLMVEGGKIDWACHSNDAATAFEEVIDMDNAVKVAYEFYAQHPDETLIVITADHETGGLVLGRGPYELNLQVLKNQKVSENGFTKIVNGLRAKYKNQVSWEVIRNALKENFGFWGAVTLDEKQEARLKAVYDKSFGNQPVDLQKSEYLQDEPIATEAKKIIDEIALLNWASGGHSAGFVPVYAIGAGAERFQGQFDNALIPVKIAEAAGYAHE